MSFKSRRALGVSVGGPCETGAALGAGPEEEEEEAGVDAAEVAGGAEVSSGRLTVTLGSTGSGLQAGLGGDPLSDMSSGMAAATRCIEF